MRVSSPLAGVSIEFLCFPRAEEPIENVTSCLQGLCTLLDSPFAKTHIAEDQVQGPGPERYSGTAWWTPGPGRAALERSAFRRERDNWHAEHIRDGAR